MDLHIGVTTSTGAIVEFDRCGLRRRQWRDHRPQQHDNKDIMLPTTLHQTSMKFTTAVNSGDTSSDSCFNKWEQSLLVEQLPEEWSEHWDTVLEEASNICFGNAVRI